MYNYIILYLYHYDNKLYCYIHTIVMSRMSMETRQRVFHLRQVVLKTFVPVQLQEEGVKVSDASLCILLGKFSKTGKICDLHRTSRPRILTHKIIINSLIKSCL